MTHSSISDWVCLMYNKCASCCSPVQSLLQSVLGDADGTGSADFGDGTSGARSIYVSGAFCDAVTDPVFINTERTASSSVVLYAQ
jgi:hypothetical protein